MFVLSGSSEELKSPRALKILVACAQANVPLQRTTAVDNSPPSTRLTPPPSRSDNLVLQLGETRIASSAAGLRFIAKMAPAANLLGYNDSDAAVVDSWMSFCWSALELPLQVGAELELQPLEQHLLYQTYFVGSSITLADITIASAFYAAGWDSQLVSSEPDGYPNVARWYQTVTHQDCWRSGVASLSSLAPLTIKTISGAASTTAISLNGTPTPVQSRLYRRHRFRIKEVLAGDGRSLIGQSITVAGWAKTIRKASAKLFFVELNDGSSGTSLQCVLDVNTTEGFEECKVSGGTGASFQFLGIIVASQGSEQPVDMNVTSAKLLGAVYGGNPEGTLIGGMLYPMSKKEHTLEFLREQAHLRARGQIHAAAMRVRHAMAYATHNFFHNHGFLYIHTPIITGADAEGAGEQFAVTSLLGNDHLKPGLVLPLHPPPEEKKMSKSEMKRLEKKKGKADTNQPHEEVVPGAVDYGQDFFAQRVNLTVSGQLNVETHACALCDVYTFGPTFRAEESRTYRHLSEFWMIEPEIAFADLTVDINLAEDYLKYCVEFALEHCADDLEFFENSPHGEQGLRDRLRNVLDNEFKRLTYTEAVEILKKAVEDGVSFEVKPEWGIDLPSEHERYICEKVFNKPVVLTDYPKDIKAFYMKVNDDGKTVAAADILVPKIGEIIGGSQREHRLDMLRQRCTEMGLDPRAVWWYLDLRRYGTVPHAGFGLGFERLILFITGLDNIRDVIPFPRWVGNAKF